MRKITSLLMLFCMCVGMAWGQSYQQISHVDWSVTACNEAGTYGNEGGVAFLKDENPSTFYHSSWSASYDGHSRLKGQDGYQAFMIEMPEALTIDRITYKGRSDKSDNWAKKARVYVYETLPTGLTTDLASLSYDQKQELLKADNANLGTPAFDNTAEGAWGNNTNVRTIDFSEAKNGKYILFVVDADDADAVTGSNGYLTCSEFNLWQKVDGIEENKPYYLKITNLSSEGEWYLDTYTKRNDTQGVVTIGKSQNPVATYFFLKDGYWHLSTKPNNNGDFLKVGRWGLAPQSAEASALSLLKNSDGTYYLIQKDYEVNTPNRYIGGNTIIDGTSEKVYTNNPRTNAIKIQLVELSELAAAKETAKQVLSNVGVGYPALDSEARTTLQTAVDAADATAETVNAAIAAYQSAEQDVVWPVAGKVYRLVSGMPGFAINKKAIYSNGSELRWGALDNNSQNQLWVVQNASKESKSVTILNLGNGLYPQRTDFQNPVPLKMVENVATVDYLGKGQFRVKSNGAQGLHANGHSGGAGVSGNIINYNTEADAASAWYFVEVDATQELLGGLINGVAKYTSPLIKKESTTTIEQAVSAAQSVYTNGGDYSAAFETLVGAFDAIDVEYVDVAYFYLSPKGAATEYMYFDAENNLKTKSEKGISSIIKFEKIQNGTFAIKCANGYSAQQVNESAQTKINNDEVEYSVTKNNSGYYVLRPSASSNWRQFLHRAGGQNVVGWSEDADNTQWTFESLSEEEIAKIYNVVYSISNSNSVVTYNNEGYDGNKAILHSGGFYLLNVAPQVSDFSVQLENSDYSSELTISGNNIYLSEGWNSSNIFSIRNKANNGYARYLNGCVLSENDANSLGVPVGTNMLASKSELDYSSFFFIEPAGEGKYDGYYTIRSVSSPNLYAYNLGTEDKNSRVGMMEAPAEGGLTEAYYWKISSFGEEAGNITPYGGDEYGWNRRGGSSNGDNLIGYWKSYNTSDDNLWYVKTVEETCIPHTEDNSVYGYYTYESVLPYLQSTEYFNQDAFNKLKNAPINDIVLPEKNTFLRLKNVASKRYMTAEAEAVKVYDACEPAATIFYVDENNTLLSYAFGRYYDASLKKLSDVGQKNSGEFGSAYHMPNVLSYRNNGYWVHGNKGDGNSVDRGTNNGVPTDQGYSWLIEEVTALPVTIGTARASTLYAPVALSLPTLGEGQELKVYTAVQNGEYLTLTEVEDVIPANTGVILMGTAATYNFTISDDNSAPVGELTGTVATKKNETPNEDSKIYTLQKPGGVFMMKKYSGKNLNGFKAYYEIPAGSNVQALRLSFGETTGIDGVVNAGGKLEIYDMSGRRVEKMTKGLYIVNGQKVLVK